MYVLTKLSSPGWEKKFEYRYELVKELRNHICRNCLYDDDVVVDTEYNGSAFICEDIPTLLSTPCGLEFSVEKKF